MNNIYQCKLCNRSFSNINGFQVHINRTHKLSTIRYYDTYLKSDNEGRCLECGNKTKFIGLRLGYRTFCCCKCAQKSSETRDKSKQTCLQNYGVDNIRKSSIYKDHCKNIKKQRYNDPNYNNPEKQKQTCLQNYGVEHAAQNNTIKNKARETSLKKFGYDNPSKSPEIKEKIRTTFRHHYGVDNCFQARDIKEKIKQTSRERYGCENPGNSREARNKAAQTRRKNNNDSSWEDYLELRLQDLGITYEKRYDRDDRYPFPCDFYIPENDTFIEINGYWSHGGHFFDDTNHSDLDTLSAWKIKAAEGHRQYQNAINVWTIKDLNKLTYAKNNNLNYVVLWTLNDIDDYCLKLERRG